MNILRISPAIVLLALCSPAADIAPVVSWSVETDALQPSLRGRKDLELIRGETVVLECQLLSGGAALNLAEATSVRFRYTAANPATNATHYVITGAVHNAAAGKVRVRWTPAAAPAADRLQYEIAVGSPTSTACRAWGLLRLLPGVGDDSTAGGVERSTIDWSTVESQNVGDAPWPVNMVDLGDVDATARAAGKVIGWDGTNHVYVAQGGHDPVTRGAGDIGTLVGQVRAVTTNQVRAACADYFLRIIGGALTGDLELANGAGYSFALGFRDAVSVLHTLRVTAAGVLEYDDLPVLTTSSSVNAATLGGETGSYYRNWANITNRTGVLVTDADKGDLTVASSGTSWTIDAGAVTAAKLETAARTVTVPVSAWKGPIDTEIPGWAYKSFATTNTTTTVCEGLVNYETTQRTATIDANFKTPAEATAWKTTGAIVLQFFGDSTTTSEVCYRVYVYRDGTSAAIYDTGATQALASTTGVTTLSIPASSLGTFSAGTGYTIRVQPSVKYATTTKGFYFHNVTVQVIK